MFLPERQIFYQFGSFSIYYGFFALLPIAYREKQASDGQSILNILRCRVPNDVFD